MSKRCVIITSNINSSIGDSIRLDPDDYIVCADGGAAHALREDIIPHLIIGDFDSSSFEVISDIITSDKKYDNVRIIKTKPEKDDTDTFMCASHAISNDINSVIIIGGLSGRLDHTVANIQTLSYLLDNGIPGWITDGKNKATLIEGPDEIILERGSSDYFSIYSFTESCNGVYERGSKYLLENTTLTQSIPFGTSNEFMDGPVVIGLEKGKLLIIMASD